MSLTLTRRSRARRLAAGAVTTALAASALALVPTSANADVSTFEQSTLTWNISQQFTEHLSARTLSGGASFSAEDGFTFVGGQGTFNATTGEASFAYKGSVKGAFSMGSSDLYSVTVENPEVTVNAAGEGTISALVSSASAASAGGGGRPASPAAETTPMRVVVTTFDADEDTLTVSGSTATLAATPDWQGVIPAGSDLDLIPSKVSGDTTTELPIDGAAFAKSFISQLVPGVRAHFYASTSNSDSKKHPGDFEATLGARITSVEITQQDEDGLVVEVEGAGYAAGYPGIYVSIGETGNTNVTDADEYLGTSWVGQPAADAVQSDGTFATTLSVPAKDLDAFDPAKDYSVLTFKAHGQAASDPSQNASTPIDLDFKALGVKYIPAAKATAKATVYGNAATVNVSIPAVAGFVPGGKVSIAGASAKSLVKGKAAISLSKALKPGTHKLKVSYAGDSNFRAGSTTVSVKVNKDSVTISDKVTKKPTTKKAGKVKITVKAKSSTVKPSGKVTVYFKKKGEKTVKTSAGTLKSGVKTLSTPKLKSKGTWTIYVKYSAGTGFNSVSSKKVGTVKVSK